MQIAGFQINRHHQSMEHNGQPDYEQALVLFGSDKFKQALEAVDRALRVDGHVGLYWMLRSRCCLMLERVDEAFGDISRAISLEPNKAQYYMDRALIHNIRHDMRSMKHDVEMAARLGDTAAEWVMENMTFS